MSFEEQLRGFSKKTTVKANAIVKKIVIDVGSAVVLKSPVGDANYWKSPAPAGYVGGRFRGNWQYSLSAPDTTTSVKIDKDGSATIAAIVSEIPSEAMGKVHYITNSLPYAKRLEEGYSRQAPNGMVRLTVLEFEPIVIAAAKAVEGE